MQQFELMGAAMLKYRKETGVVSMIRPDGTQPSPGGYSGGGIDVPWGLNIDGNDDVWVGNFSPLNNGVVVMAGDGTKGHPAGTKTGDVLHVFRSGSLQLITDVSIDAAGNVWAANNWYDPTSATSSDPVRRTSTWGPGQGIAVIYGAAAPVKPPRMGAVVPYYSSPPVAPVIDLAPVSCLVGGSPNIATGQAKRTGLRLLAGPRSKSGTLRVTDRTSEIPSVSLAELVDEFKVRQLPGLVEERFCWSIESEPRELSL